ncbi:allene oxide synthase-like [Prunus yedoensis var. nudiflora]|uniref:Allene oxide synthase-like n=1 Tax=Prunus yedoensis var. nudiflora TaxID=2094558 RepID=A0A314U718_PRUYE|nr:allene oxide synthase-like [Prunus yedoensis var. nudiflora]
MALRDSLGGENEQNSLFGTAGIPSDQGMDQAAYTWYQRRQGRYFKRRLKFLYWSNGRQMDDHPTAENKQCPGKDVVVLMSRLMLVEFFLRYDTFTIDASTVLLGFIRDLRNCKNQK